MDFNTARFNMVEQQIRPWDVLNFDLLDVLGEIPRERFVLPQQQGIAYTDQTLALANGGKMLEPKVAARLIQGLDLNLGDHVLEVGTGSGYATAILAKLAGQVTTFDIDSEQQKQAAFVLGDLGYTNIHYHTGDGLVGVKSDAPFSAVYVGGSIPVLPQALLEQLPENGRLVAIIGDAPVMLAKLFVRQDNAFHETVLFETVAPSLHSAATPTPSKFVF